MCTMPAEFSARCTSNFMHMSGAFAMYERPNCATSTVDYLGASMRAGLYCFFKGQGPLNGARKHAWLKEQRRRTAGKPIESACRWWEGLPKAFCEMHGKLHAHISGAFAMYARSNYRATSTVDYLGASMRAGLYCFFKGQGPLNGAMKHAWLKEQRRCTAGKPIESACRCVNSYTPGGKASQKLSARCTANFMRTVPVPLPCTNTRITVQHQPWTISWQA